MKQYKSTLLFDKDRAAFWFPWVLKRTVVVVMRLFEQVNFGDTVTVVACYFGGVTKSKLNQGHPRIIYFIPRRLFF